VKLRLPIEVLPRQPQIARKVAEAAGVFIRQIRTERVHIVPSPHHLIRVVGDDSRRIQVIGMYIVDVRSGLREH
jgi:hypothetical protein